MEAATRSRQHRQLRRAHLEAGRLGKCEGYRVGLLSEGSDRPAVERRSGLQGLARLHGQILSRGDKTDGANVYAPSVSQTLVQVLKQCGDNLTRENVMKQAANLHDFTVPMLLPGITINTSPTDFAPIKQIQMARFDGEEWRLFGPIDHRQGRRLISWSVTVTASAPFNRCIGDGARVTAPHDRWHMP